MRVARSALVRAGNLMRHRTLALFWLKNGPKDCLQTHAILAYLLTPLLFGKTANTEFSLRGVTNAARRTDGDTHTSRGVTWHRRIARYDIHGKCRWTPLAGYKGHDEPSLCPGAEDTAEASR